MPPQTNKEMCEFDGWYLGNNKITTLSSSYCENLTITAKWKSIFITSGTTLTGITDYGKTLQSIIIPNGVTSIGSSVFSWCSGITSITIPDSVTSIGSSAFYGCAELTSITIPESVIIIGSYSFTGCTKTQFTVGGTNSWKVLDTRYKLTYTVECKAANWKISDYYSYTWTR